MAKKLRIQDSKLDFLVKLDWKYVSDRKLREKSHSQGIILKFNQIVVLNSIPESNSKPEVQNPKWWVMKNPSRPDTRTLKPDPTRNPKKVYPISPYLTLQTLRNQYQLYITILKAEELDCDQAREGRKSYELSKWTQIFRQYNRVSSKRTFLIRPLFAPCTLPHCERREQRLHFQWTKVI